MTCPQRGPDGCSEAGETTSSVSLALALGFVVLVALALRLMVAGRVDHSVTPDDCYYWHVARNMAAGRGMVADVVWNYSCGVPTELPVPAHGYWMPLTTWIIYPFVKLFGPGYASAQVPALLCGLGMVVLAFCLAWSWWQSLPAATLAGLLAALGQHYAFWSVVADTAMPYGVLLAGALWCMSAGLRGRPRALRLGRAVGRPGAPHP